MAVKVLRVPLRRVHMQIFYCAQCQGRAKREKIAEEEKRVSLSKWRPKGSRGDVAATYGPATPSDNCYYYSLATPATLLLHATLIWWLIGSSPDVLLLVLPVQCYCYHPKNNTHYYNQSVEKMATFCHSTLAKWSSTTTTNQRKSCLSTPVNIFLLNAFKPAKQQFAEFIFRNFTGKYFCWIWLRRSASSLLKKIVKNLIIILKNWKNSLW